jgi:hypothetical protein
MAQRRQVIPVTLTHEQREKLERLWFIYGNHGPKMTKGNHSFIQGLLERGRDERPLKQQGWMPTEECEGAVDKVLAGRGEPTEDNSGAAKAHRFKLVSTPAPQNLINLPAEKGSELKELIKSLQKRSGHGGAKADSDGGIPPAA